MELCIKWKVFKKTLKHFIYEADVILGFENNSCFKPNMHSLLAASENWITKCYKYLRNSFKDSNNEYATSFIALSPYNLFFDWEDNEDKYKIQSVYEKLKLKKKYLNYILKILSVSDAVIEPKLIEKRIRADYSEYEISDLILDKLYHLYDNYFYPLNTLLGGNGIHFSNASIPNKIIKKLSEKGLVHTLDSNGSINIQLSQKGLKHVKLKRKFKLIDKIYIKNSKESKYSSNINKTNLGKNKLVKELNELRLLHDKLSEKQWLELLKGKLINLSESRLINRYTAEKIFLSMTKDD